MEAIWEVFNSDAGTGLVLGLISLVFGFVKSVSWVKERNFATAVQALEVGVQDTYENYVKGIKAGREDGKLTEVEKIKARQMAIDTAKAWAMSNGVDILKLVAKEYLPVLVEKLVKRSKTLGGLAKTVLPLSPEVPPLTSSDVS